MPRFVHIAPANQARSIARAGLKPARYTGGGSARGVYAMAVLPQHELTYQWAREMRRWARQRIVAATFVLPRDEPVLFGHFNTEKEAVTAAEAVARLRATTDPRGFEVIVPRAIRPDELRHIRPVRALVGWRYAPDAHGRQPCGCPVCARPGEPYQRKLRERWERDNA